MNGSGSSKQKCQESLKTKPVSFSFVAGVNAPAGREGHCSCAIGDKVYIFGGVCQSGSDDCAESGDLLMFDISTNEWCRIDASGDIPSPRSAAVMNAVGKKLYLFGGLSQYSGWFKDVHVFDTENANWSKLDSSGSNPSGRDKLASAVIGEKIYYFGGFGPKGGDDMDEDDDEEYEDCSDEDEIREVKQQQKAADFGWFNDLYILDTASGIWSQPMQMNLGVPTMRAAHGMCSLGQYLLIFGGRDPDGRQNDVHIFDTVTRKWNVDMKESGSPPDRRSFHTFTAVNENLAVVFGGRSESHEHFNDINIFNMKTTTWYQVPLTGKLPPARGCHTVTVADGKLMIYGGSSDFIPEIQHCQKVHSDVFMANCSDLVDAVENFAK